ncbi:hypothetical protein CHS0354_006055 [Potamilus streckersoni]|uniref:CCHC-type domain-containing protein n=1 Tax=Potamilus streckersoni TaxID=2493646 RepID=A0AAE0W2P5_9BIVA|nr:hypothetical protein CHS0354_006055 [Potamilus streckersoni]
MNRGVTPHNYYLRNRLLPKLLTPSDFPSPGSARLTTSATSPLLTPSDFTPPGSAIVKPSASFTPTTSLLLETAATYSSPVTLYPPLEPVSTVLTSAPRISSKPISTPMLQSLPHDVLLDLTSSTFTPAPLAQPPRDTTSLPPAYSSQFDLGKTTSPVLVPPERIPLFERQQSITQTFPTVSETRTFTVQPSSVNFSSPEHYSRSASIFGNNRSTPSDLSILQTQQGSSESVMDYLSRLFQIATNKTIPDQVLLAVALNGLKPSVKRIVMNKTPTNMAELRQAAVLAEKSIATTDTTDFSTLNTILNEVKQIKDEVKVANSKQTQDSISSIQTHAHVNVTKPPFRTPSSNYQTSGQSFRPNTTYTSAPPAFPKSYPSRTPPSQSLRGPRYQPQPHNGYPTSCFRCGEQCRSRGPCRARNAQCHYCHKIGHFSRVCLSTRKQ